jgi:hypothetical protein
MEMVEMTVEVPGHVMLQLTAVAARAGVTVEHLASLWLANAALAAVDFGLLAGGPVESENDD